MALTIVEHTRVLIVGSGGNGIATAVCLQQAGITDFRILTKHDEFGGTWYQNTYPGCAVDVPSSAYQLGCSLTDQWTATHASQAELAKYLQQVATDFGLYERTHFRTELLSAEWVDDRRRWSVTTNNGIYTADVLILVTGFLEEPSVPKINGATEFGGRIFHSSLWPRGYTGQGDRVAVVGTGSSSLQIVPAMQKVASSVVVFQRTPQWILPKEYRQFTEEERRQLQEPEVLHKVRDEVRRNMEQMWSAVFVGDDPEVAAAVEAEARKHLESQVIDPELRRLITPTHRLGCKRQGISDDYYPALQAENVQLVPEAAVKINGSTIVSASGRSFEVDTIVLATGFNFGGSILSRIKRRDGVTVGDYQQGHPRAYKAVTVCGCPNLFLVGGAGPNGQSWNGLGAGEIVGGYIAKALTWMRENGIEAIEVLEAAELSWKRNADAILARGASIAGGCGANYSLDEHGYNKAAWPGTESNMRRELSVFDHTAYIAIRGVNSVACDGRTPN